MLTWMREANASLEERTTREIFDVSPYDKTVLASISGKEKYPMVRFQLKVVVSADKIDPCPFSSARGKIVVVISRR